MTTTAYDDQLVPQVSGASVKQEDREAAAAYVAAIFSARQADQTRKGVGFLNLVQAFARHRKEATHPASADVAELVEAGKRLLGYEGHHAWCGHGEDMDKPCVCGLIAAQDRLRAALSKHGAGKGEA